MKIDLEDLEHDAIGAPAGRCPAEHRLCMPAHPCATTTLALIARIRDLEGALDALLLSRRIGEPLPCNCDAIRVAMGPCKPEHRIGGHEPDCVATNAFMSARAILEKGALLP